MTSSERKVQTSIGFIFSSMLCHLVSFQIYLISEYHELLFHTGWVSTDIVVLCEVSPQVRILSIEVLHAILLTDLTEEMFSPAVLVEFFLVVMSSSTESALWVFLPSVGGEASPTVECLLSSEEVKIIVAEVAVVLSVFSPHVSP